MSSKSTIILTGDNEHWYEDCSEVVKGKNAIVLEFDKKNIRVDINDSEELIITLVNPDSDIYQLILGIDRL